MLEGVGRLVHDADEAEEHQEELVHDIPPVQGEKDTCKQVGLITNSMLSWSWASSHFQAAHNSAQESQECSRPVPSPH